MMKSVLFKAAIAAALPLVGLSLYAADPPRADPPAAPGARRAPVDSELPRPLRAKQILGSKISIQNNTGVGIVDDIVLSEGGDVDYLIVMTGDKKLVSVPWSTVAWGTDFKSGVVNVTPEQFKVIPTYTVTTYPDYFAPTYRSEVYKYYGVPAGQLRRIERRRP